VIASVGGSPGELAHDHRGQHHDGADGEIDARGQDDQRLRCPDDADDRHLLEDKRQCEGREELASEYQAEDGERQDEDDERYGGRVGVQEMLALLQPCLVMGFEGRDLLGATRQNRFVLVLMMCGCLWLAHDFSSQRPSPRG
jgi:hypothetical protein